MNVASLDVRAAGRFLPLPPQSRGEGNCGVAVLRASVVRAVQEPSYFGRRGMTHRALMGSKALKTECDRLVSHGARVHQIQYEVLVRDPARVMLDVCRFLDVPFVPSVASLEGADQSAFYQDEHHSLVKGGRIASSPERSEVLPVYLKRKIERYVSLWREENGGKWPILSSPPYSDSEKPCLRERLFDRVLYRCLRTFDSIIVVAYCIAPFWFLKRIRALTRGSNPRLSGNCPRD